MESATPPRPAKRSRRGCLLSGCLTLFVIALLVPTALYFYAKNRVSRFIDEYTATAGIPFPELALSARETARLEERLARFQADLDAGNQPDPFTLSADDLNALIARQAWLYNKVRVSFSNDIAKVHISMPLQGLPIPIFQERLRGRYINGEAGMHVSVTNGAIHLQILSVNLNAKTPPEDLKQRVHEAFANSTIVTEKRTRTIVSRLQAIILTNGSMTLQPGAPPR